MKLSYCASDINSSIVVVEEHDIINIINRLWTFWISIEHQQPYPSNLRL